MRAPATDTLPIVPKRKMVMRSIRVPEKLWNRAKRRADREEQNISDIVRELLAEYAKDEPDAD